MSAAVQEERDRLLAAALAHVPFDGWSAAALEAGARDLDADPGMAAVVFPGGGRQACAHFSRWADRAMTRAVGPDELAGLRMHERIAVLVGARFDALAPHREAVRRGLTLLALPRNAALASRLLYRTVDDVWYAAGDRSADFSFYTRRGLLAGVIASTTLYWLDDASEDQIESRRFLDRRLGDVMRLYAARGRIERLGGAAAAPLRVLREALGERYGLGGGRDRRVT